MDCDIVGLYVFTRLYFFTSTFQHHHFGAVKKRGIAFTSLHWIEAET